MYSVKQIFEGIMEFKSVTIVLIVMLLAAAGIFYLTGRQKKWDTRTLVFGSLCISVGFVLSYIRLIRMPQGGSITPASMLPVMFFAYVFGPLPGILAGVVYGLLQLIQDFYVSHPIQLIMDYPLAFACLGLAGFFRKNFYLGIIVSGFGRFLLHFISGMVFFGAYAPAGTPVWQYSLVYNASVIGPDLLIVLAIALIPQVRHMTGRLQHELESHTRF